MASVTTANGGNDDHLDLADMRRRLKAIFIGSIGNLVEWYDWYAYAAFSLYFAGAFFPNSDPVVQQLNAALLFAVGFLVRPIGGWLFGYLADHHGRRGALMLSVLLMCFGSLMIAVTPAYASIGVAAPVLLGLARMMQGLSLGGEYGTSATYLSEMADAAPPRLLFELPVRDADHGQFCALLVLLLLQQVFLTTDADPRLGLAHSVRHRRAARGRRAVHAAQAGRDRRVRGGEQRRRRAGSLRALLRIRARC